MQISQDSRSNIQATSLTSHRKNFPSLETLKPPASYWMIDAHSSLSLSSMTVPSPLVPTCPFWLKSPLSFRVSPFGIPKRPVFFGAPLTSEFSAPGLSNHCLPHRDPSPPGHAPSPQEALRALSLHSLPQSHVTLAFLPLALDLASRRADRCPLRRNTAINHVTRTRLLPSPPEQRQDSPASF